MNSYSALKEFDAGLNAGVVTAPVLQAAGANSVQQVEVRGKKMAMAMFAPTQHVGEQSSSIELKPDPVALKKINGAAETARYTPQRAMNVLLSRLADDKNAPAELRQQARAWARTGATMSRFGMNSRALNRIQAQKGEALVGKISAPVYARIDADQELRHSLSKAKPKSRNEMNLNADQLMKHMPKPTTSGSTVTANTTGRKLVSELRGVMRPTRAGGRAYSLLRALTPEGMAGIAVSATLGAASRFAQGGGNAPQPSTRRRPSELALG